MFSNRTGSRGGVVKAVTGSGTPAPVASTGISSYFSKLMPVCCLDGSFGSPKSSFSRRVLREPTTCTPLRHTPDPGASCWPSPRDSLGAHPLLEERTDHSFPPPRARGEPDGPFPKAPLLRLSFWAGRESKFLRGEARESSQPVLLSALNECKGIQGRTRLARWWEEWMQRAAHFSNEGVHMQILSQYRARLQGMSLGRAKGQRKPTKLRL